MGIALTLPDGTRREVAEGTTAAEVASQIGPRLAKAAVAAKVGDRVIGLKQPIEGGPFTLLTFADPEGREVYRHSTTHIMAQAVKRFFPEAKLAVGPPLEDGYYYDIWLPRPLTQEDLERIEGEMNRIIAEDHPIERQVLSREEAIDLFRRRQEDFKLEIIESIPEGEPITAYRQGEFIDLCRGPHLPSTGRVKAVKLLHVAGAYWKGDENGPVLQRIYGTSFDSRKELEEYLWRREEAKSGITARLGPELDLFSFKEEAPGFVFWHPKGMRLYRALEAFSRELQEARGYQEVATPWIMRTGVWETLGHWGHYRENMFVIEGDEAMAVKPMNCPAHCLLFRSQTRSYRDLPLKLAEYGPLSRFERSGTLHGLLRVRGFHQDDAHLFVRPDQIEEQIREVIELVDEVYGTFGMPVEVKLSTRPADYMGSLERWEEAEAALARALDSLDRPYKVNPGDGAFYGPKLDFDVTDSLGRRWQCATVQLDFQFPAKFGLRYTAEDGKEREPVIIHRAIFGSLERFIGILVEHYAGAFPLWLAPVQVRIIPIADRHVPYAARVRERLGRAGLRVELDDRPEKVGYKIRAAQLEKVPYMLVIGDKEVESGHVALRSRADGDLGPVPVEEAVDRFVREVASRGRL